MRDQPFFKRLAEIARSTSLWTIPLLAVSLALAGFRFAAFLLAAFGATRFAVFLTFFVLVFLLVFFLLIFFLLFFFAAMVRQTLPIRFYFSTELAGEALWTRALSIGGVGAKARGKEPLSIETEIASPGHQHGQVLCLSSTLIRSASAIAECCDRRFTTPPPVNIVPTHLYPYTYRSKHQRHSFGSLRCAMRRGLRSQETN